MSKMKKNTPFIPEGYMIKPLLKLKEVLVLVPVCKTAWYDGIKSGIYPASVSIGKRSVAWSGVDIQDLINSFIKDKDEGAI